MKQLIDVLVVGAGPAGSTLAIDLARRGLTVRIIDRAPAAFEGSRAKAVQPRTLEVFEDLGVLDDILAGGGLYPRMGFHLGPFTVPWRMLRHARSTPDIPYPNTWLIPQFRIDRALHQRLGRLRGAIEFNTALLDFEQDAQGVTARITTTAGIESVRARYLVGADGGASQVRKTLGIRFEGSTDEQDRILIVDATVSGLRRDRWHIWPGKGGGKDAGSGGFTGACPLPHSDAFQWMLRLAPGETPPSDLAGIAERITARTRDRRIVLKDILWTSVFRPNIRLAERYRVGRVFLAGDAAHVHTPAGGQGLNTGVQDAYNLGWKLAQVLAGADDGLLDSYEAERQPIAAGVLGLSSRTYAAIGKLDPAAIRRGKDEQQLGISYRSGPLALRGDRTRTLSAGDRAPDAVLRNADGLETRLFQSFIGPHFSVIAYGSRAASVLRGFDTPRSGASVRRIYIDAPEVRDAFSFTDANKTFRQHYGVTGDLLLVVRPDGYVASIEAAPALAGTRSSALGSLMFLSFFAQSPAG